MSKNKLVSYYSIPITIALVGYLIYSIYRYYISFFVNKNASDVGTIGRPSFPNKIRGKNRYQRIGSAIAASTTRTVNIRENFTNKTTVCNENSCGMGCKMPDMINDDCPLTVYKDSDGKCHRKCPYQCNDTSEAGCRYNQCCFGCGYKKFEVPCDLAIDEYENTSDEPSPDEDKNTTNNSSNKSKNLNDNMTDVNHKDIDFNGWSPFVTKWPCSMNVTGTFTECGPPGYNSCSE